VRFWAKLLARILTAVLYNIIHVSGLGPNLVSLGALHKEKASVFIPPSLMVVPEHNIVKTLSINLDAVMRPNNTGLTIEQPKDTTVNIQHGHPTLCASIRGPCNNSLLPLNSSPPSKIDYTK